MQMYCNRHLQKRIAGNSLPESSGLLQFSIPILSLSKTKQIRNCKVILCAEITTRFYQSPKQREEDALK